jgi:hypothetical protein
MMSVPLAEVSSGPGAPKTSKEHKEMTTLTSKTIIQWIFIVLAGTAAIMMSPYLQKEVSHVTPASDQLYNWQQKTPTPRSMLGDKGTLIPRSMLGDKGKYYLLELKQMAIL